MTLHAHDLLTAPLYRLAVQSRRAGSLHKAIHTYRLLVREIDPADMHALSLVFLELGTTYLDFGQPHPATQVLRQAHEAAQAAQLPLREAECLIALGQAYRLTERPGEALACFLQAHPLFADQPAGLVLGRLWNQQGLTHLLLGAYTAAKEDFAQALTICRTTGDSLFEAEVLQNLGHLYVNDLEEIEQGIQYLETALALRRIQGETQANAAAIVQILAEVSGIKLQRKETIAEVFPLLVEAERWVRLSLDPALAARISSLQEAVSLLFSKYAPQSRSSETREMK